MSGFPTQPTNRAMADANLIATTALPNGNQTVNSNLLDINQNNAFPVNEVFDALVTIPACANVPNLGTITVTVVSNATNNAANSTAIAGLATIVATGNASAGTPLVTQIVKIPGFALEFLGIQVAGIANTGNQIAQSATLALLV